jgi:5-methylcytosine-specific restriction endonuclease McrA
MYRDGSWTCALCGAKITAKEVEIDHIVPKAEGGSGKMVNLRVTCRPCNQQRARDAWALQRFGEAT